MPYADKEKKNEHYREAYAAKYDSDPAFRQAEAERKAAWYQRNLEERREKVRQQVAAWRAKQKALKAGTTVKPKKAVVAKVAVKAAKPAKVTKPVKAKAVAKPVKAVKPVKVAKAPAKPVKTAKPAKVVKAVIKKPVKAVKKAVAKAVKVVAKAVKPAAKKKGRK
jgi:hypothetical protein